MGKLETEDARRWRVTSLLLFALAVGILTGLGEWLFLATQRLGTGRIVFLGRHAAWMKPVAEGLLFLGLAGLLVTIGSAWGKARSLRAVAFVAGALGALSLLLLVPPLHWAARLVLALGIGVQFSRLSARWLGSRERLARRVSIGVATAPVALAIVWIAGSGVREGARTARLGDPAPGAPNVLLLILDTVRAHSLGLYGHERPTTPELERIAGQGVRFDRAYSPSSWTLPSHASMFTGRPPHQLSADWRSPLDATHATLAEYLSERGYVTAGFVANMGYCGWETGLARGFQRYEDHPVSWRQLVVESSILGRIVNHPRVRAWAGTDENFVRKKAADVNGRFLGWLESRAPERPFFAFLNYYDAHGPYQPPEPFRSELASGTPRGDLSPLHRWNSDPFAPPPEPEAIRLELEAYEASIAWLDREIGRLVEELDARGHLDETILIVASDHGEEFGEHGVYDHGNSLYLEGLWVPLVIRYPPRAAAGRVVTDPVGLADLPATIVDLAGLAGSSPFPGASLAPLWDGSRGPGGSAGASPAPRTPADSAVTGPGRPAPSSGAVLSEISRAPRLPDWFPVSRGDMKSLVNGRWHYILNGDGVEELYDLRLDPAEQVDRAKGGDVIDVLADFRDMLARRTGASAGSGSPPADSGR